MTRLYWCVDIDRVNKEDKTDDDLLYYGSDVDSAYCSITNYIQDEDKACFIIGKCLIFKSYCLDLNDIFKNNKHDMLIVKCWEDDDGSDETLDD